MRLLRVVLTTLEDAETDCKKPTAGFSSAET